MALTNKASRRAFLKAVALTGTLAAAAVELLVGCDDDDDDGRYGYGYGYGYGRSGANDASRVAQFPLTGEGGADALSTFREAYDRRRQGGGGPWSPGRGPSSVRDLG